jgi:hypothetical protein
MTFVFSPHSFHFACLSPGAKVVLCLNSNFELNQDYVCIFTNCYSQRFVAALAPGETYTATMDWNAGYNGVVVPANVISVVAQGVISP